MNNAKECIWLFDYDLTLYSYKEAFVLDSLDRNITLFLERKFDFSVQKANQVRKDYCQKYGTTLAGLRAEHGVSPEEYFDFIHSGNTLRFPEYNAKLIAWLNALPGKKSIFTNARADWMLKGLQALGVENCFENIIDIESMQWSCKPDPQVYKLALEILQPSANAQVIFFEDKAENLEPAKALGWRTVLVHPVPQKSVAEWQVKELTDFDPKQVLWNPIG